MNYVERKVDTPMIIIRGFLLTTLLALSACQTLSLAGLTNSAGATKDAPIPAAAQAQFDAALAAQNAQQWDSAEQQFNQLLEKYPWLSGPALNLALIYTQTQKPQLAEEFFKRALQINPNSAVAGDRYGVWLRTQGRFDDAEKSYLATLAQHPDYADSQLNLAILYDLYLNRPALALEHYQRYLELIGSEENSETEKNPVHAWVAELQRRMQAAG